MKIKVDGTEYEFPTMDSITMDESILLERYAGVGIEEIVPGEKMPMGAIKAFVVIAIRRARPEVSEKEIAGSIGKITLADLPGVIEADDASPPVETPSGSGEATTTSGTAGTEPSESAPVVIPLASGSQDSATGSPSVRETSAG